MSTKPRIRLRVRTGPQLVKTPFRDNSATIALLRSGLDEAAKGEIVSAAVVYEWGDGGLSVGWAFGKPARPTAVLGAVARLRHELARMIVDS